jgi:hypothetical protein
MTSSMHRAGRTRSSASKAGRADLIHNFVSGEDTLVLKGFATVDSYADLEPYFVSRPESSYIELDLPGAAGVCRKSRFLGSRTPCPIRVYGTIAHGTGFMEMVS